jgi:hypothetical protein
MYHAYSIRIQNRPGLVPYVTLLIHRPHRHCNETSAFTFNDLHQVSTRYTRLHKYRCWLTVCVCVCVCVCECVSEWVSEWVSDRGTDALPSGQDIEYHNRQQYVTGRVMLLKQRMYKYQTSFSSAFFPSFSFPRPACHNLFWFSVVWPSYTFTLRLPVFCEVGSHVRTTVSYTKDHTIWSFTVV